MRTIIEIKADVRNLEKEEFQAEMLMSIKAAVKAGSEVPESLRNATMSQLGDLYDMLTFPPAAEPVAPVVEAEAATEDEEEDNSDDCCTCGCCDHCEEEAEASEHVTSEDIGAPTPTPTEAANPTNPTAALHEEVRIGATARVVTPPSVFEMDFDIAGALITIRGTTEEEFANNFEDIFKKRFLNRQPLPSEIPDNLPVDQFKEKGRQLWREEHIAAANPTASTYRPDVKKDGGFGSY